MIEKIEERATRCTEGLLRTKSFAANLIWC
jgi:hypothetical protein